MKREAEPGSFRSARRGGDGKAAPARRAGGRARRLAGGLLLVGAWLLAAGAALDARADDGFSAPEKFTDGALKYQLSRTADNLLAFDSQGALHAAYWAETRKDLISPLYPNYVFHRTWRRGAGWSAQEEVDNSDVPGSGHLGGRHPSLAVAPNDTVWIVWHDHRHCSETPGNWMDNTEIYADFKPAGGVFSTSDLRMTTSAAAHLGDNGYTAKIVAHSSGRLSLAWHDFHQNADVSDIYLKTSNGSGVFDAGESMDPMQMTDQGARGGAPAYAVVDLAIDTTGTRHLVWAGGEGSGVDLYYAEAPVGASGVTERVLAANGTDFFDPPHVAVAPNGDVWVAYGDDAAGGAEDVTLLRRRAGQPDFDPPIVIASHPARQYAPDPEIDAQGRVHLVWIDERDGTQIYYGVYDPSSGQVVQETRLTSTSGPWARPTLALDENGKAYVVFEESRSVTAGDLWFTTAGPTTAGAGRGWLDYP